MTSHKSALRNPDHRDFCNLNTTTEPLWCNCNVSPGRNEINQRDHRWHVVMRVTRRDCMECWPDDNI